MLFLSKKITKIAKIKHQIFKKEIKDINHQGHLVKGVKIKIITYKRLLNALTR